MLVGYVADFVHTYEVLLAVFRYDSGTNPNADADADADAALLPGVIMMLPSQCWHFGNFAWSPEHSACSASVPFFTRPNLMMVRPVPSSLKSLAKVVGSLLSMQCKNECSKVAIIP